MERALSPSDLTQSPDRPNHEMIMACKLLAEVPNRFRAVGTWINHFCLLAQLTQDQATRTLLLSEMEIARRELDDVMLYFTPGTVIEGVPIPALDWWHGCLRRTPEQGNGIRGFAKLLREVLASTEGTTEDAVKLHERLVQYAVAHYGAELNALTDQLSARLAEFDQRKQDWHTHMQREAHHSVQRIEKVSQMVRLISLNASVEAARAGDAGKSFGVIAQEITRLSDTIRDSSNRVGHTIEGLVSSS